MIAPPIPSTTTNDAGLSTNVSGALQDVTQAVTKLVAANTMIQATMPSPAADGSGKAPATCPTPRKLLLRAAWHWKRRVRRCQSDHMASSMWQRTCWGS
ncbi:hypothetical protein AMAG_11762 [Allomyces macrogynus ATCC 38327]|uniref:Uncharacterized protein n=1 Tax=Allomyces macrogynus (strain ATCC 38327) TaxID=578462 RepID=A0A0L0SW86_ALLM3|nr:hypothetical protein AMAG_11762 [Allomyces macrogynus ATCC 38327]|eukprot:KNE66645.1 hypothetical protein AMAG_11762 [Allomyces macrogynus ATCC 38327]